MPKLSESQIQARLTDDKGWDRVGDELVRSWQFASTRRALEFVHQVVDLSERLDHHPDIILSYRTVRIELSTHTDGGLTDVDFLMADALSGLSTE